MAGGSVINNSLNSGQIANEGKNLTNGSQGGNGDFDNIGNTIISKFTEVIEAAIVIVLMFFIIHWIKKYIAKVEIKHDQQRTALNVVEKLLVGFVIVIGVTIALKIVGIDMSVLVGVGLLGLSYALKDIIQNYIAGLLIFLKAPFKIGDIVKIKSYVGKVDKMEFQSTSLKTFDHRDVTIYNSDIISQSIENYSRHNMRRMEIDVNLGYGTDIQKITGVITKILDNNQVVLKDPKYSISFKAFTHNCMIIKIKFWVPVPSNFLEVRSAIAWQINEAFDESTVFGPYERSFQASTDFSLTPERQNRIKSFYNNQSTAPQATATATTTPGTPVVTSAAIIGQTGVVLGPDGNPLPQEVVTDIDEPQIDEEM